MNTLPPLIALAQGRKVRARKAPVIRPKEIKLQVTVADLLRAHCLPDWRWTHINRTAKDARQGAIFKNMGVNRGWGDFELISPKPNRLPHFLELKRIGEEIEEGSDQDDFRIWCVENDIPHALAWTIDEVLAVFEEWGCLRVISNSLGRLSDDSSHPA
jgi:hypothetical protein